METRSTTRRMRRLLAIAAIAANVLVPAQLALAEGLPIANPTEGEDPQPPDGPGDLVAPEGDDDCHPLLASCDLVDRPEDEDPDEVPETPEASVDDAVVANPTFTG